MHVYGKRTGTLYSANQLLAQAGEGAVYTVLSHRRLLLKIFTKPLDPAAIRKLELLCDWPDRPTLTALPIEIVFDASRTSVLGFIQPYFQDALTLSRLIDSQGRKDRGVPDSLTFRIKLARMLAEAFMRLHAANLVMGDVSDSNFLVNRSWWGTVTGISVIDCNSFQVSVRSAQGSEFFPSGVATEEYAAAEVQSTDWSTSSRSVYSDSFGFAVLAWKLIFNGSHPFSVVTPRSVDAPPLGQRIERHQFPFAPRQPMPSGWSPPQLKPDVSVLPNEVLELFRQTFTALDPRDRPTVETWYQVLAHWEASVFYTLARTFLGSTVDRLSEMRLNFQYRFRSWYGPVLLLVILVVLSWASLPSPQSSLPPPAPHNDARVQPSPVNPTRQHEGKLRERALDPELFPADQLPSRNRR